MKKSEKILVFFGVGAVLAIITALMIKPATTTQTTTTGGGTTQNTQGLGGFIGDIVNIFKGINWGGGNNGGSGSGSGSSGNTPMPDSNDLDGTGIA